MCQIGIQTHLGEALRPLGGLGVRSVPLRSQRSAISGSGRDPGCRFRKPGYSVLRNGASGPETELPGRVLDRLNSGKPLYWPSGMPPAGRRQAGGPIFRIPEDRFPARGIIA